MTRLPLGFGLIAMSVIGCGLQIGTANAAAQDEAATPEFYTTKVQPIFQANCYRCHGGMNHRGGLNIQTRDGMLKG